MLSWDWSGKRQERFIRASEYTRFHKRLAENLAENELRGCRSILDAGCGLGLLSLALAESFQSVTAIDQNADAIASLKERLAVSGVSNITAQCGNCFEHDGGQDAAVMCFVRSKGYDSLVERYSRVVRIANCGSGCLSAGDERDRHSDRLSLEKRLFDCRVSFSSRELELEFGQPLVSLEDARDFARMQTPGATQAELDDYLHRSLRETGDAQLPYYIAHTKQMAVYLIETKKG